MSASYTIGQEIMYEDERYVIADITETQPKRYRLLATTKAGTRVEWAREKDLFEISSYLDAFDDTASYT